MWQKCEFNCLVRLRICERGWCWSDPNKLRTFHSYPYRRPLLRHFCLLFVLLEAALVEYHTHIILHAQCSHAHIAHTLCTEYFIKIQYFYIIYSQQIIRTLCSTNKNHNSFHCRRINNKLCKLKQPCADYYYLSFGLSIDWDHTSPKEQIRSDDNAPSKYVLECVCEFVEMRNERMI